MATLPRAAAASSSAAAAATTGAAATSATTAAGQGGASGRYGLGLGIGAGHARRSRAASKKDAKRRRSKQWPGLGFGAAGGSGGVGGGERSSSGRYGYGYGHGHHGHGYGQGPSQGQGNSGHSHRHGQGHARYGHTSFGSGRCFFAPTPTPRRRRFARRWPLARPYPLVPVALADAGYTLLASGVIPLEWIPFSLSPFGAVQFLVSLTPLSHSKHQAPGSTPTPTPRRETYVPALLILLAAMRVAVLLGLLAPTRKWRGRGHWLVTVCGASLVACIWEACAGLMRRVGEDEMVISTWFLLITSGFASFEYVFFLLLVRLVPPPLAQPFVMRGPPAAPPRSPTIPHSPSLTPMEAGRARRASGHAGNRLVSAMSAFPSASGQDPGTNDGTSWGALGSAFEDSQVVGSAGRGRDRSASVMTHLSAYKDQSQIQGQSRGQRGEGHSGSAYTVGADYLAPYVPPTYDEGSQTAPLYSRAFDVEMGLADSRDESFTSQFADDRERYGYEGGYGGYDEGTDQRSCHSHTYSHSHASSYHTLTGSSRASDSDFESAPGYASSPAFSHRQSRGAYDHGTYRDDDYDDHHDHDDDLNYDDDDSNLDSNHNSDTNSNPSDNEDNGEDSDSEGYHSDSTSTISESSIIDLPLPRPTTIVVRDGSSISAGLNLAAGVAGAAGAGADAVGNLVRRSASARLLGTSWGSEGGFAGQHSGLGHGHGQAPPQAQVQGRDENACGYGTFGL